MEMTYNLENRGRRTDVDVNLVHAHMDEDFKHTRDILRDYPNLDNMEMKAAMLNNIIRSKNWYLDIWLTHYNGDTNVEVRKVPWLDEDMQDFYQSKLNDVMQEAYSKPSNNNWMDF